MPSETHDRRKGWSWHPAILAAGGFGLGWSPVASGTTGTLAGLPLVLLLRAGFSSLLAEGAAVLALCLLGVPLCGRAERYFGKKDDGRIVADEFLTFPLCLLGLPLRWEVLVMAFLTHRFFDILKPPPADACQRLPGGWGIMADDVVASLYALACNHALYALMIRFFSG